MLFIIFLTKLGFQTCKIITHTYFGVSIRPKIGFTKFDPSTSVYGTMNMQLMYNVWKKTKKKDKKKENK